MALIDPEQWRPSGIEELEPGAWRALRHPGSAKVVAGPGAGKTEFLAQRAAYLLQTGRCARPHRILAISFSEMRRPTSRRACDSVATRRWHAASSQ